MNQESTPTMGIKSIAQFQEVETNILKIRNEIADIFNKEKTNAEKINGSTNTWVGKTQETIYKKHKQLSDNYDQILETLDIYLDFLKNTRESYVAMDKAINRNIERNTNELDVNS